MQRTTTVSACIVASALLFSSVSGSCALRRGGNPAKLTTKAERDDALRRAQVWRATNIPAMDLKNGPQGPGAYKPRETITCNYEERDMSGRSPKFTCVIPGPKRDDLKVKYGLDNAEVYGEMLTTRLLWALGFGADRMYSVRVVCRGCPDDIKAEEVLPSGDKVFDPAVVERKMTGWEIASKKDQGWAWPELDKVDPEAGGAPQAHRDALKLLAVMVQHSDSKPSQQRLICLDAEADSENAKRGACQHPFMLMQDTGLTFGKTDVFYRKVNYVNLTRWASVRVWRDPSGCIGNLYKPFLGTLEMPRISEAGRVFLASLLHQLTDAQIRDLFEAARVTLRPTAEGQDKRGGWTTDEWIAAFKLKRSEIAGRSCLPAAPLGL